MLSPLKSSHYSRLLKKPAMQCSTGFPCKFDSRVFFFLHHGKNKRRYRRNYSYPQNKKKKSCFKKKQRRDYHNQSRNNSDYVNFFYFHFISMFPLRIGLFYLQKYEEEHVYSRDSENHY